MVNGVPGLFLLRKSKTGTRVPVVRDRDLPIKFQYNDRTFEIRPAKKGGISIKEIE